MRNFRKCLLGAVLQPALLQVPQEQPTFRKWLLQLRGMPPIHRNQLVERMSRASRIEDGKSPIAAAFDRLHNPALFEAVRRYLADESRVPETGTA